MALLCPDRRKATSLIGESSPGATSRVRQLLMFQGATGTESGRAEQITLFSFIEGGSAPSDFEKLTSLSLSL